MTDGKYTLIDICEELRKGNEDSPIKLNIAPGMGWFRLYSEIDNDNWIFMSEDPHSVIVFALGFYAGQKKLLAKQ